MFFFMSTFIFSYLPFIILISMVYWIITLLIRFLGEFLIMCLNIYYKVSVRLTSIYLYYIVVLLFLYLYLLCCTFESNSLVHVGILKYFYSSLYLHILFAYVFVLCCIYAAFIEYYSISNIIYFIINIRWSWFFYTKEEVERSRNT